MLHSILLSSVLYSLLNALNSHPPKRNIRKREGGRNENAGQMQRDDTTVESVWLRYWINAFTLFCFRDSCTLRICVYNNHTVLHDASLYTALLCALLFTLCS